MINQNTQSVGVTSRESERIEIRLQSALFLIENVTSRESERIEIAVRFFRTRIRRVTSRESERIEISLFRFNISGSELHLAKASELKSPFFVSTYQVPSYISRKRANWNIDPSGPQSSRTVTSRESERIEMSVFANASRYGEGYISRKRANWNFSTWNKEGHLHIAHLEKTSELKYKLSFMKVMRLGCISRKRANWNAS